MAGGGGVEHDETVRGRRHRAGEGAEHGDLDRARRAQVLFEHGPGGRVHPCSGLGQDLGGIGSGDLFRVYTAHPQRAQAAGVSPHHGGDVGGRVGGSELHRVAPARQFDSDPRRQSCLPDPALAHREDKPPAALGHLVDQFRQ